MPVTFFAHQAPVLPLARKWPLRLDGIALVIGSMAPDMAYVLNESRFDLWAHSMPWLLFFCVPVTLLVSWIVARIISPALWDHLPNAGPYRLRDYRGLADHRFVVFTVIVSAFIGAVSHVVLDSFTHDWGWFAQNVDGYDTVVVNGFLGRDWTLFRVIQYVGHVVCTAFSLWLLARYGRQKWMAASAARVRPYPVTATTRSALVFATALGATVGLVWVRLDFYGPATSILRISACTFAALTVTCAVLLATRPSFGGEMEPGVGIEPTTT